MFTLENENKNGFTVADLNSTKQNKKSYCMSLQAYQNDNENYQDVWELNTLPQNDNELSLYKNNINYIISFIMSNQEKLNILGGKKDLLKTGIKVNNCNLKETVILYYHERMSLVYSKQYESLAIIEGVDVEKSYDIDENKQYHYKGLYMGFNKLVGLYPLGKILASDVIVEYFRGLDEALQNWNAYIETGITHDMV